MLTKEKTSDRGNGMILRPSLAYKPGAGAQRDYWAVKKWLYDQGIALAAIARDLGVHPGIVSSTIRGTRNTRHVLKWLLEKGCPVEILSLPDDLK